MRYPKVLSKAQVEFLVKNPYATNEELAKKFKTTKAIIARYKSRARQAGFDIPYQKKKVKDSLKNNFAEIKKKLNIKK